MDLNTNGPLNGKEILLSSYPPLQIPKQKTNKEGNFETALNILTSDSLYKFKGHFNKTVFIMPQNQILSCLKLKIKNLFPAQPLQTAMRGSVLDFKRKTIERTDMRQLDP